MAILKKKSYKEDQFLSKKLAHNAVFLGPTDTILGLMAPLTLAGKEKLDQIKGRQKKPYLIIIGSFEQLNLFIDLDTKNKFLPLLQRIWPGPITLILKARTNILPWCSGKDHTVALRMPNHPALQQLALTNEGLFSTSANISGMPTPQTIEQVDHSILQQIDFIVVDDQPSLSLKPSTIINCTTQPLTIIRQGSLSQQEVEFLQGLVQ